MGMQNMGISRFGKPGASIAVPSGRLTMFSRVGSALLWASLHWILQCQWVAYLGLFSGV